MQRQPLFLLVLLTLPVFLNAWADWQTISSKHFRIYYKNGLDSDAARVCQILETERPYLEKLTGGKKGQIPLTIEDLGCYINGYADPFNTKIALFTYPPTRDELATSEDWLQMVACHEYIHLLQMTREKDVPMLLRIGFSNYLYPQIHQPYWMSEGITVYGESQISPYSGRLNGGTYPPTITILAKADKLPSPTKASYYSFDTPHAHFYTFGGAFHNYLARTYGEDKFALLYDYTSGTLLSYLNPVLPFFSLDKAYIRVYGKPLSALWQEWKMDEANNEVILPIRNLTSDGWYKSDLQISPGRYFYYAGKADKTGPGSSFFTHRIMSGELQDKQNTTDKDEVKIFKSSKTKPRTIVSQATEFPAGFHVAKDRLYYTRLEYKSGFANSIMDGFGLATQLWLKDLVTGKREKLCRGQIRAFLPLADGKILLSEDNKSHTASNLFMFDPVSKDKPLVYEAEMLIHSLHKYNDIYIIGGKKDGQNCSIYSLDLTKRVTNPIVDTPYYETPVSVQGDSLIFNAAYDRSTSAYIYNLQTNRCYHLGDFYDLRTPAFSDDGRSIFISLNNKGYDIYQDNLNLVPAQIPSDELPVKPQYKSFEELTASAEIVPHGKAGAFLDNLKHMAVPRLMHLPFVEGTGDSMTYGMLLSGSDVTGDFPNWNALVAYDTYYRKLRYSASLANFFFRPVKQYIGYSNDAEQTLASSQYLTFYGSMNYGLSDASLGFSFMTKDDFQRQIWTPYLLMNWKWASGSLMTMQSVPYEETEFTPSDRQRLGWQGIFEGRQKLPLLSELRASVSAAYDPDADSTEVFYRLRGYEDSYDANKGVVIRSGWYKPVFQIREGLWNPQIYVEDVNLGLFYDSALPLDDKDPQSQFSAGMEVL
ncbi:MAG: hypothetical protein FJ041_05695, partial [Candidatus Cloacimonetes bacterium]|nr:hypothetical protein [Candidatus Cloacimonadota bacterium]